jgi:oligopeptidase B
VKVLDEAERTVRAIHSRTGLGPDKTCLYGRSAGGLWAGGLAATFPKGEIAGSVYMEVPYLDVLRTLTNRNLPLTDIETDEFGLPEQRLSDLVVSLRWSPMELLALQMGQGIPGVRQLIRTGLNDSQVYAYESMKWITRSRGVSESAEALLAIEGGQGHFVNGRTGFRQKAADLSVVLTFLAAE